MSTLKTNTIQHLTSGFNNIVTHTDGAGTVNAAHARAWVCFNASSGTPSINANFNISSITDNGAGDYTLNFTNAMSDANYVFTSSGEQGNQINVCDIPTGNVATYKTASSLRFNYAGATTSATRAVNADPTYCGIAFFR